MIDLIFQYFNDTILVRINGTHILFGNTIYGGKLAEIEGLKLSQSGVIKEFPDLKNNNNWRSEAIERFKMKIDKMKNEEEIADYLINDLKKYGYKPKFKQQIGFRPKKL